MLMAFCSQATWRLRTKDIPLTSKRKQNPSIKFTIEKEQENQLLFLNVRVRKEGNQVQISIS